MINLIKDYTKEFKKVKMLVTVFNENNTEEDEFTFPFLMPNDEYWRVIEIEEFSDNFEDLINAYRLYFARIYRGHEVHINFAFENK